MSGDKQPRVMWSGPKGSRPITLADFRDTPGLLAWLFGDTERHSQPHQTVDMQHQYRNRGSER